MPTQDRPADEPTTPLFVLWSSQIHHSKGQTQPLICFYPLYLLVGGVLSGLNPLGCWRWLCFETPRKKSGTQQTSSPGIQLI